MCRRRWRGAVKGEVVCGLGESLRINSDRSRFITVYFEKAGSQPDSWSGWSELLDLEDMWTWRVHTFVYFWPGDFFHGSGYNPKFSREEILMLCNTLLFQRTVCIQLCGSSLCFNIMPCAQISVPIEKFLRLMLNTQNGLHRTLTLNPF